MGKKLKPGGDILNAKPLCMPPAETSKVNFLDKAAEFREKTVGLFSNDDIDRIFNSGAIENDTYESDVFEGVF